MEHRNFGLIEDPQVYAKDWYAGGVSGVQRTILRESGDYTDVLPQTEYQIGVYFDTMACVTFSALNCLEILSKLMGEEFNWSDRFIAKMSGTTSKGNSLRNVAEAIRLYGLVPEEMWPYDRLSRNPNYDWDNYYQEIPQEVIAEGQKWLSEWDYSWEWVPVDQIDEYLKYGPVQVGVYAWPKIRPDKMFDDAGNKNRNHAVTNVKPAPASRVIFDHYDNVVKDLVPGYDFKWAMQHHLKRKSPNKPPMSIPNNTLVQEVEQSGTFGLFLNGKIMVDDLAKILATWMLRNDSDVKGKSMPIKKEVWDSYPKFDLKNNPL